jgi:hypothetical protein
VRTLRTAATALMLAVLISAGLRGSGVVAAPSSLPASDTLPGDGTVILLPLLSHQHVAPVYLRTRIGDITKFLERCPTVDRAFPQIRREFIVRIDGVPVNEFPCSGSYATLPIAQLTQPLITMQVMRTAWYMDPGTDDYLPWTSMSLYDWMIANVRGVNLKSAPGMQYCCDTIDGEKYISQSLQSPEQREHKRTWPGISSTLHYFAHEIRHADGGPGHVTGCAAFPDPGDAPGCDADYDLGNLGSYGVQYWLESSWLSGHLHVGMSCAPDEGSESALWHWSSANMLRSRFVANVPPLLPSPMPPYGGPCWSAWPDDPVLPVDQ